jgi:hypothetical protein|tara:strand:- start:250 stop:621 length:372 start_codon:yes stop_codon:yes gene_type:complete
MSDVTLKIFVDQVGRTVIGALDSETDTTLVLKNPCTIFVQPNEQGQLQVQTVPMFFREFLTMEGREKGTKWTFNKSAITDSDCAEHLDDKLKNQYATIVDNFAAPDDQQTDQGEPEVVKLFDD